MSLYFAHLLLLLAAGSVFAATVDYNDQANWGGVCQTGTQQTPINLTGATSRTDVQIYYQPDTWSNIVLRSDVTYLWQYNMESAKKSTIRYRYKLASTVAGTCQEAVYTAIQLHFHRSSEHQENGSYYTSEMHIVHVRNPEYIYCSNMKEYLVLGIFFNENTSASDNQFLADLKITDRTTATTINFNNYFSTWLSQGVYNYHGSFTTPGCDEKVEWLVSQKVEVISTAQKNAFSLMGASNGQVRSNRDIKTNSNTLHTVAASFIFTEPSTTSVVTENNDDEERWRNATIPIIVILVVVLIVVIVICFCCYQKKNKTEQGYGEGKGHHERVPKYGENGSVSKL